MSRGWPRKQAPGGYLVRPSYMRRNSRHFVSEIVKAAGPRPEGTPSLDCRRLRTTWIVHHLRCGTDASVLLRAAGLASFASLDRYLDFVEWPGDDEAFRSLRGDW